MTPPLRAGSSWYAPCPRTPAAVRPRRRRGFRAPARPRTLPHVAWYSKFFPESIFARKLPEPAERRLRLAQARAEESIVRAHVDNALMFMDTLAEDLPFDRAIETYIRVMGIPEPLASTVATRALVVLGQDLVPFRRRQRTDGDGGPPAGAPDPNAKPRLRLDDAAEARRRQRA